MLMLTTSSQVLVTATTSFAMTAHLAVNLVWLWCFLRDDRIGHIGAVASGFIGCGLHQLVFHPLFVAPFIANLWVQHRRSLVAGYVVAYAAICAFWILYPSLVLWSAGVPADHGVPAGASRFLGTISHLVGDFSLIASILLMIDNTLRFLAWQHVLLIPLGIASLEVIRRAEGLARPLVAGPLLTIAVAFVLIPWQGNGWGYRYLHGLIGNLCLLAGYGWLAIITGAPAGSRAAAGSLLGISTAFTFLVLLPAHILQTATMEAPFRAAMTVIRRSTADLVLVDPSGVPYAEDLVRNDPYLRNRPKVMDLALLDLAAVESLCSRFTVSVFDRDQATALGFGQTQDYPAAVAAELAKQRDLMRRLGCGEPVVMGGRRS
jgi:hypothetical protein